MHNYLFSITYLLVSLTLWSPLSLAQDALGQLESLAGRSASSVNVPDAPDFGCGRNCPNQSSSGSNSSGTTYTPSPGAAFASGFAGGFMSAYVTSLLSGPSPAEMERRRQMALEAERRRVEEQRRMEERNKAIQARLISNLAPIGGQRPSMNSSVSANGTGNAAIAANALGGKLVSLDDSADAHTQGQMFDTGVPSARDAVDLRLVDLETATPKIPKLSDPIRPRSRLPDKLVNDEQYIKALQRKALDEEILAETRKKLSELDNKMYNGEIDVEKWRQDRAAHLQDIANLENIIARQEGILRDRAIALEVDPSLIYEDRAEVAYLKSGHPDKTADRTLLAYDRPTTSTISDLDVDLTPEASHLLSTRRLEILNDAEFGQLRQSIVNSNFSQQVMTLNLAEQKKNYQAGIIDFEEWQNYQTAYNHASSKISQDIKANNDKLDALYKKYEFTRPADGEFFY